MMTLLQQILKERLSCSKKRVLISLAGTMMLSAIGSFGSVGSGDVSVLDADDSYEPNDSLGEAYRDLGDGVWLSSVAGYGVNLDDDWFRVSVTDIAKQRVKIECRFLHNEGDIDIILYDASGNVKAEKISVTDNEYIDIAVPNTGYYYVKVWSRYNGGNSGNSYDLMWKTLPTGEDLYEPNNTLATAYNGLPAGVWLSTIDGFGLQCNDDWYRINVTDDARRRVVVDCTFLHSEGDIDIVLYNAAGGLLDYPWTNTDDEHIDFIVPSTGYYYVKVCYENRGNAYDLIWNARSQTPVSLISISISGASSVDEQRSTPYTCTATYSDGLSQDVTATALWTENSDAAEINASGVLATGSVASDQTLTISVSYNGKSASKDVTIRNITKSFTEWLVEEDVPENLMGYEDVVADDCIPNLLKYACGLPAHQTCTSADLMSIVRDNGGAGVFSIEYKRSKSAADALLEVLWAPAPAGPWLPVEATEMIGEEGDLELRRASIPLTGRGFMRLRATPQ
jgi:hypothetical protein